MKPRLKSPVQREQNRFVTSLLVIPVILLVIFSVAPAVRLVQLSFCKWKGLGPVEFNGLNNYATLFSNDELGRVLLNVLAYVVIMLIQLFLALFLAIILNNSIKGNKFFRSVIFLPYMLNGVAVAFMFNILYNYERGPINEFLRFIGLGEFAPHWISADYSTNFSLALISLWRYTGFNMVVFLGGLQSVSNDLYEAAELDGASFIQKVRYITIPSIHTTFEINLLLGINGALQAYFEPFVITKGGPNGMTDTFVTKSIKYAFDFQNFGLASALAVVLIAMIVTFMLLAKWLGAKRGGKS